MTKEQLDAFYEKYKTKLNEPIMIRFLQVAENRQLVDNYILSPTPHNKEQLDEAFTEHFRNAKMYSYISKLIKFYTIDFDKRLNKQRKQVMYEGTDEGISLDKLHTNIEDSTFREVSELSYFLEEHIENEDVYRALKQLNELQMNILNLIYVHQLSNKEVAKLLGESEQKISYNHKSALQKVKKMIERRDKNV
ncbi:sigma-70 family RNA polymerase sigma factor [Priestia taiwanensis]|uniref:DNA-directed RNA polymerase sigma-70 factor n=1 Tax=Priestia taiwanensis TaxID=1347902 RepID=A0A917ERP7_9BACI|nr:sigma-70 family RNA polymerase sigma factor [Priestia taiwanensis]MBM7363982.1 RNA polymerase sigma factor (sigma-70 family) [Priestia taiwanensis]GGE70710.1 DNA-directed RNA polymerase sigma-70 factor [Priestia taiwanensis]